MKKLIILGIALSFGLSSCGFFDFGPVPIEPSAYAYIQAKTTKGGDNLCVGGPYVGDYNGALKTMINNGIMSSGNYIEFDGNFVGSKTIYIESTLNNWTVKDMKFFEPDPPGYFEIDSHFFTFKPVGAEYPSEVFLKHPYLDLDWFKFEWPVHTVSVWDVYSFETPIFSGPITITKLDSAAPAGDIYLILHVKGYSAFTFNYFPSPMYTGFMIKIKGGV